MCVCLCSCVYLLCICYYGSRYWFYSAFKRVFDMNFYGNRFYDQHSNVGFTFILLSISTLMRAPFVKYSFFGLVCGRNYLDTTRAMDLCEIYVRFSVWNVPKFLFMQWRICHLAIYSSTFCIIFIEFFSDFFFTSLLKTKKKRFKFSQKINGNNKLNVSKRWHQHQLLRQKSWS